jgi:hypothetical protein
MSLSDARLWELKQTAKWSWDIEERKKAITDIAHDYGEEAIGVLSEIKDTTVYEEIRRACIDAITSAGKARDDPPEKQDESSIETADKFGRQAHSKPKKKSRKKGANRPL